MDLGVALLVDGDTAAEARRLRAAVMAAVPIDSTYSPENIPHLTLFQGRFPSGNVATIEHEVMSLGRKTPPMRLELEASLYLRRPSGNVFWNARSSPEVQALHDRTVERLNPLREGCIQDRYAARLESGSGEDAELALLREFGFPFVGAAFLPHITIAKLQRSDSFASLEALRPTTGLELVAAMLVIGEIGTAGDLRNILFRCPLIGTAEAERRR